MTRKRKRTKADLMRMLPMLLEEYEWSAQSYRRMAAESEAAMRGHCGRYDHGMHMNNRARREAVAEAYEKCASSLRAVLGLDPQPTAAKPEDSHD